MLNKTVQLILLITVIVYASLLSADNTPKPTLSAPAVVWSFSQMPNKASLRGTAIIQNSLWVTGSSNSVFVSQDSGEIWQRDSVPLYQDTQTSGGYSVALNHLEQAFVIGGDYLQRHRAYANMARLNDEHWEPINTGSIGLRTAMSCHGKIWLTTGKTSTDISFDAGNTWQVLINKQAEGLTQGFYSLASDDYLFIATGAEGKVGVLSFKEKITHH